MKTTIRLNLIFLAFFLTTSLLCSCCIIPYVSSKEYNSNFAREGQSPVPQPAETGEENNIQEIETEKQPSPDILQDSKEIQFNICYDIKVPGNTDKIVFTSTIPDNYSLRQKVVEINYSPEPSRVFYDGKNKYAEFVIQNPDQDQTISISSQIIVYDFDLLAALEIGANQDKDIGQYLEQEKYIEVNNLVIAENNIVSILTEDPVDKIKIIYDYVMDSLYYDSYNPESVGAVKALKNGSGDCTEYTDVFVALCRASGFAARSVEGYFLYASDLYRGHNWPEVYLNSYGWVPFDPTVDDGNQDSTNTTFYDLQNAYLYLSFKRNDPVLQHYHYYYYRYRGDNVDVTKKIDYFILDQT